MESDTYPLPLAKPASDDTLAADYTIIPGIGNRLEKSLIGHRSSARHLWKGRDVGNGL